MIEVLLRSAHRLSEKDKCTFMINPITGMRIDYTAISIMQNIKFIGFEI